MVINVTSITDNKDFFLSSGHSGPTEDHLEQIQAICVDRSRSTPSDEDVHPAPGGTFLVFISFYIYEFRQTYFLDFERFGLLAVSLKVAEGGGATSEQRRGQMNNDLVHLLFLSSSSLN